MIIRFAIAAVLATVAATVTAQAQLGSAPLRLDGKETSRQFQQRTVNSAVALLLEGQTSAGSSARLNLDVSHELLGALPEEAGRCGAINGILAIGLPAGIEFVAEPRLYFQEPATGAYKFMYSNTIDQKPWLPDISQALGDASSTDPNRIYQGITALNTVLDKRVTTVLPSDGRLLGRDPGYSIAGKSWIVPCDVMFHDLTDIFVPEESLLVQANLRLTVPVKFTSDYCGEEIVVYAGFLSTAVARVTMLPSEIPPGAIILVEQPEGQPAPPATEEEQPAPKEPAAGEGQAPDNPAGPGEPPAGEADARETAEPAPDEAGTAAAEQVPPPPPEPIEALIYSFEWISWETASQLKPAEGASAASVEEILAVPGGTQEQAASVTAALPAGSPAVEGEAVPVGAGAKTAPGSQPGPAEPTPSQPAVIPSTGAHETGESTDVIIPGEIKPKVPPTPVSPAETPTPEEVPTAPPVLPATAYTPEAAAAPALPTGQPAEAGAVEIAPGTLPLEDAYYVVPLKPITGTHSAAGGAPGQPTLPPGLPGTMPGAPLQAPGIAAGQFVPPADLGEMVLIPEGYFLMGTSNTESAGDADELPQGQVFVPAFHIDKHLVTNRQFYAFVVSSGYKPLGSWDNYYDQGTADMPVRGVTWDDANAYARWAGKRLPTEAEWEKAARGTDGRLYPWGAEWSSEILPRGDYVFNLVHAPGALSPYGVQSMVGVLWQWTSSAYAPYPFNPAAVSEDKVLRGGCYSNGRNIIRCANRYAEPSNVALNTFGFRCVRDA